jgi:hypothetical protein
LVAVEFKTRALWEVSATTMEAKASEDILADQATTTGYHGGFHNVHKKQGQDFAIVVVARGQCQATRYA